MSKADLHTLLQHPHLWRASDTPTTQNKYLKSTFQNSPSQNSPSQKSNSVIPTGYIQLDELLTSGHHHTPSTNGWPRASCCELLTHQTGIGELRLLMPGLCQLNHENRWIAWIAPPYIPYAPALSSYGLDLRKMLIIHCKTLKESLWATEQCLQSDACSAILAWPQGANYSQLKRLQIAATSGQSWGIFFRPAQAAQQPSPIPLRIRIARGAEQRKTLALTVLKRPGGWPSRTISLPLIQQHYQHQ